MHLVGGIFEHAIILVRRALFSMSRADAGHRLAALVPVRDGEKVSAGPCARRAGASHLPGMLAPDATPAPIAVDRLVKRYNAVKAVDGITFSIAAGACVALLGGNGAGKTTTISTIMGLVEPTSGLVTVLGAEMPRQRHRVLHRMNFESPYVNMPMRLTVRQNLRVFGMLYGCAEVEDRIAVLAGELDLGAFLDRSTGSLSSGQKTRVALAKSLINQPEILLLDEPTASLDPDTADWVRARIERYRQEHNATLLIASHNMAEVERLCDRVIMLKAGRIEDDDTPERLIARYGRTNLEEVFLDIVRGTGEAREAAQ
jgi:ABC-2 type transport system ATP-binding protein